MEWEAIAPNSSNQFVLALTTNIEGWINGSQPPVSIKTASTPTLNVDYSGLLQRKCACGKSASLTGKCSECEGSRLTLQRKATHDNEPSQVPPIVHEVLDSSRAPEIGLSSRSLKKSAIQSKLKINEPGDRYEQEADRIADQVMRMPEPIVYRQVEPEEEMVQREAIAPPSHQTGVSEAPSIVDEVLRSPDQPLDPATRAFMEPRFGQDFSRVRVHSSTTAEQSAREMNAHAYTLGHNIVFGTSRFAPRTHEGQRLIAHELTHVVQQSDADGMRVDQSDNKRSLPPNFPASSTDAEGYVIAHNQITQCARLAANPSFDPEAVGGIVLRHVSQLTIHQNQIAENGVGQVSASLQHFHPVLSGIGDHRQLYSGQWHRPNSPVHRLPYHAYRTSPKPSH